MRTQSSIQDSRFCPQPECGRVADAEGFWGARMASRYAEADDSVDLILSRRAKKGTAHGADPFAPLFSRFTVGVAFALSPLIGGWIVLAINGCLRGRWLRAGLLLAPILVIPAVVGAIAGLGPLPDRVSFPMHDSDRGRPEMLAYLRQVRAMMVEQAFPGEAVSVRLCNLRWKMQAMLD